MSRSGNKSGNGSENRSELVSRARQGESDAIAQLIGSALMSQGIHVEVEWQLDRLHIGLEGEALPPAKALVPTLRQGFERLAVRRAIAAIQLSARRPGQSSPDWVETFTLNPILDASPTSPAPTSPAPSTDSSSADLSARQRLETGGRQVDAAAAPALPAAEPVSDQWVSPGPLDRTDAVPAPAPSTSQPEGRSSGSPAPADSPAPSASSFSVPVPQAPVPPVPVPQAPVPPVPVPQAPVLPVPVPQAPVASRSPAPSSSDPYLSDNALVILAHLAPLLGYLAWFPTLIIGLPFLGSGTFLLPFRIVAPLLLLLTKGKASSFIRGQSQEALNFQISLTLYWLVTFALMFLLVGFLLVIPLAFFEAVCIIVAAVKASDGKSFRYPLTLRFVR